MSAAIVPPWYRQFWPWFLLALPGSVVIACFVTLFIAIRHSDSIVRDNYYRDGLAINQVLAQDRVAAEQGLSAALRIDAAGQAQLELGGALAAPPRLHLQFIHPLISDRDFQVELSTDDGARFIGRLPAALAGRWQLELTAVGDSPWRLRGSIDLAAPQPFPLRP